MNIYLRKICKHDITHQISTTKDILTNFFDVKNDKESVKMKGEFSGNEGDVSFLFATDPRFGGDIKKILLSESKSGNLEVDDIIIFKKNKKNDYTIELVQSSNEKHDTLISLMDQRHLTVSFDAEDDKNDDDTQYNCIDKAHQRIFFGAPGTGKSFLLNKEAQKYFGNNYARVTFHPNYMYGNFVGSYKPFPKVETTVEGYKKETITYEYIEGVLVKQLVKALTNPDKNYLILIEEINRANVAAVFGDIFQLLDRDSNGNSEYSISTSKELKAFLSKNLNKEKMSNYSIERMGTNFENLFLPKNLYIWATMNSADQGVMPLDTAFKRRWEFEYMGINEAVNENSDDFAKYYFYISDNELVNWDEFRRALNKKLSSLHVPEDKLIGPYFISKSILDRKDEHLLTDIVVSKVLMYLYEDVAKAFKSSLFVDNKCSTYSDLCEEFRKDAKNLFKGGLELNTIEEDIYYKQFKNDDKFQG